MTAVPMLSRPTTDLARLIAMLVVCAIHATAVAMHHLAAGPIGGEDTIAVVLNQVGRFCVPLFVVLSGYGLAASHLARTPKAGWEWPFAKGRLLAIVLPYAVWSVAIDLILGRREPAVIAWHLITGGADYHFYFVPILLQCYLAFPLLVRGLNGYIVAALMLVQVAFALPAHQAWPWVGLTYPALASNAAPLWLGWFAVGMWLAGRAKASGPAEPRPGSAVPRTADLQVRLLSFSAVILAAAIVTTEFLWHMQAPGQDPGWYDHFNRWTVLLYTSAVLWALWTWNGTIAFWAAPEARAKAIALLGLLSFPVYLGHTLLLRALNQTVLSNHPLLLTLVLVLVATGVAWVVHRAVRPSWLRVAIGLGR